MLKEIEDVVSRDDVKLEGLFNLLTQFNMNSMDSMDEMSESDRDILWKFFVNVRML